MKRKHFLRIAGSGLSMVLAGKYELFAGVSNGIVDTPAKRAAYTTRLLRQLCTRLGPRPSGSAAYASGAKIIFSELKRSLSSVRYDRYTFEKWEPAGDTRFIVGGQNTEAVPTYGGEGTPAGGFKGVIIENEKGYALAGDGGKPIAVITVAPYAKAITHYQSRTDPPSLPTFSVSKKEVPLLEKAIVEKTACSYTSPVRIKAGATGINVIGSLQGKSPKEILFVAHADTVFNSPGANDNTASVIVMMMLAHAAAGRQWNHTIRFLAADNEEYGYLGAWNYARQREADGTMKNIATVINFDSLTYGPNLWISSKQPAIKDLIRSIHKDLHINTTPIYDELDGFVMDSEPFRSSGAMALHANSRGYDEKTLPVYHRPDDGADTVPLDCVEISFRVFEEFIRRLDQG